MRKFDQSKILSQYRQIIILIVLGALLLFLLRIEVFQQVFGFAQRLTLPVQIGFYSVSRNLKNTFETFSQIGSLRSTNSKLRLENATLLAENTILAKLKSENESLRQQLKTPLGKISIKASASPIGFSGLGTENILLINAGSSQGIKSGDLVVVKDILLGKIVQVNSKVSSVQLLTDPNTKIPVQTESGSEGILEGQFGSSLVLTNVSQDQVLKEGQILLTSGRNNYPKNLVVGKIKKVNRIEKELFQKAEVEQLILIKDLSLVYLISGE